MGTRQYIGARYVPKFFDYNGSSDWVSGFAYEALTIVTRNGNSYTSKKPVPANIGAPEVNSEYWAATGLFNQQVETIRDGVETLQGSVNEEIQIRESNDNEIFDTINTMNTNRNRKIVLIGDSYNTAQHYSWGAKVINALGLTEGENAWNIALAGAGFGTAANNNFLTGLENALAAMDVDTAKTVTDVVICGGINDYQADDATIATRVASCEDFVETNFPNAKFYIICAGWGYENATERTGALHAYNIYHTAIKHARILDNAWTIFCVPNMLSSDMVHPTDGGTTRLSKCVINFINGGNLYFWRYTDLAAHFGNLTISGEITPDGVKIWNHLATAIAPSSPVNMNATVPVTIATCSNPSANNFFMRRAEFIAHGLLRVGTNEWHQMPVFVLIEKQENALAWDLKVGVRSLTNGDWPLNNVNYIYLWFDTVLPVWAT